MRKLIFSIVLLTNSIFALVAQKNVEAEQLIDRFIASVSTQAIRTNFTLEVFEKNAVHSQQFSGSFTMQANRFNLETEEMKVWFNGKTQWVYYSQSDEVTITEPTAEELSTTNPVAILSDLKRTSKISFGKQKNAQQHIVLLAPKNAQASFSMAEVYFHKSTGNLAAMTLRFPDGSSQSLKLNNYQSNTTVPLSVFNFDKKKFPEAIVVDMR